MTKKDMQLSEQQIQHIAKLARLDLTDAELEKYGRQLSAVLNYIDQLKEVDVTGVEPTAQVTGLANVLREDEVRDWDNREIEAALADAPERQERFIKVKRVIE
jgi:aspartyl-tRNA(Asn)/glutamyl-tRNA(Gln) amidotransferase subunit C